jgi:hypothetical protein
LPTAADRGAAADAILTVGDPLETREVDGPLLVERATRAIHLHDEVQLSAEADAATVAVVRLLREAASVGVPVHWHGGVGDGVDPAALAHLAPPAPSADEATGVTAWRERYRPGLCYYRLGPGFVFVKDVRAEGPGARFRLGLDDPVETMRGLERAVEIADADPALVAALDSLDAEGLILRIGGWATLLPYRMRRWPVPALAV